MELLRWSTTAKGKQPLWHSIVESNPLLSLNVRESLSLVQALQSYDCPFWKGVHEYDVGQEQKVG